MFARINTTEHVLGGIFACGTTAGCRLDLRYQRLTLRLRRHLISIVIDPDLREVRLQEFPLHGIVRGRIQGARSFQQSQILQELVTLLLHNIGSGLKPLLQGRTLDLQLAQSLAHLARRQCSIRNEIEQSLLLRFQ